MRRLLPALALAALAACGRRDAIIVASKPFTESELLGEIAAQMAESEGLRVERRFYISGTACFDLLRAGKIDVYVEYTGTGLTNFLRETSSGNKERDYRRVQREFSRRWGVEWLPPLGFNNTYALVARREDAERLDLRTISDLSRRPRAWRCGFDLEFADRPDGYKGLLRGYGPLCGSVHQMSPGLLYEALAAGKVDLISGYATDGRIPALRLLALRDDRRFFPPYEAAPLISARLRARAPGLVRRLEGLAGRLPDDAMTALNSEVDRKKRPVPEVAREFLNSLK